MPPASSGHETVHLVTHSHSQPQHQPGPQTRAQGAGEVLLEGPSPGKVAKRPKRGTARIWFWVKYNPWAIVDTKAGLRVRLQILQCRPTSVTQHRALHGYGVMETQHHRQGTAPGKVSCSGPRPAPGTAAGSLTIRRPVCSYTFRCSDYAHGNAGSEHKGTCSKHHSLSLAIISSQRWGEVSEGCWADTEWLHVGASAQWSPTLSTPSYATV